MARTRTRADLILRVLTLLGAAGVGMTPSEEDRAMVEAQIDSTLDAIEAKKVCGFESRSEFDSAGFQALALRLAATVGPDFAISKIVGYEQATSLDQVINMAENDLRYIYAPDMTNEPIWFQDY